MNSESQSLPWFNFSETQNGFSTAMGGGGGAVKLIDRKYLMQMRETFVSEVLHIFAKDIQNGAQEKCEVLQMRKADKGYLTKIITHLVFIDRVCP